MSVSRCYCVSWAFGVCVLTIMCIYLQKSQTLFLRIRLFNPIRIVFKAKYVNSMSRNCWDVCSFLIAQKRSKFIICFAYTSRPYKAQWVAGNLNPFSRANLNLFLTCGVKPTKSINYFLDKYICIHYTCNFSRIN